MIPYLNLGPLSLPVAPLIYILGAWLALYAVDRAARRLRLDPEAHYSVAVVALLGGFIGARFMFVLLHWSSYDDNLLGIVWPLNSGYYAAGGIAVALAAAFFYGRWRRLALWPALDALAPGLIVFFITASLADFMGGSGYGSLTAMPWGIDQFGVRRHAVQLYEALGGAVALAVWWAVTSALLRGEQGRPFLWAVVAYAGGRLLADAYRENAMLMAGGIHVAQVAALIAALAALTRLARLALKDKSRPGSPESGLGPPSA